MLPDADAKHMCASSHHRHAARAALSVPVQALGPYVKEVIERCQFFADWVNNGPPAVYWISAFFFTQASSLSHVLCWGERKQTAAPSRRLSQHPLATLQAFMTSTKQNYARKCRIPIDQIGMAAEQCLDISNRQAGASTASLCAVQTWISR